MSLYDEKIERGGQLLVALVWETRFSQLCVPESWGSLWLSFFSCFLLKFLCVIKMAYKVKSIGTNFRLLY